MQYTADQTPLSFFEANVWHIFKNMLASGVKKMDLDSLDDHQLTLATSLLEKFIGGKSFKITLKPSTQSAELLQHFFFESKNDERLNGINTLAMGFPLFVQNAAEPIVAPLLLWRLRLEPGSRPTGEWTLSRTAGEQIDINPFLITYFRQQYQQDFLPLYEKYFRDGIITGQELINLCQQISSELELGQAISQVNLRSALDAEALLSIPECGAIYWSGAISTFPIEAQAVLYPERETASVETEDFGHPFVFYPQTPEQATAWKRIRENRVSLINGQAETGKSQTAANLLINALSNNKKCLLVSSKMSNLLLLQKRLDQSGIAKLTFLLRDAVQDSTLFLEILKSIFQSKAPELPPFDEKGYQIALDKAWRIRQKLDQAYHNSRNPVFYEQSWVNTLGTYLKSSKTEGKEVLSAQLNPQDYTFTTSEYERLRPILEQSRQLYAPIGTLKHALNDLHSGIFLHLEKADARDFIEKQVRSFLDKGQLLQHRMAQGVSLYAEQLFAHYEWYYHDFARQLAAIKDQVADHKLHFGDSFEQASNFSLQLKSAVSGRSKKLMQARAQFLASYEQIKKSYESSAYFDFQFSSAEQNPSVSDAWQQILSFEKALQNWRFQLQDHLQEEVSRLSHKTVNPKLGVKDQIEKLENDLDQLVDQINEAGLYQLPISNNNLTISKRQRFLEECMERLQGTFRSLTDFEVFYDWQKHWLQLTEETRRLVRALIKIQPQNWETAFDSWFFYHCLNNTYEPVLPFSTEILQEYSDLVAKIRQMMPAAILNTWMKEREKAIRSIKQQRKAYDTILAKRDVDTAVMSLKTLFDQSAADVTHIVPALLMTPSLAILLFARQAVVFDYLIVDEAHYIHPAEAAVLSSLAKKVVFLGTQAIGAVPVFEALKKRGAVESPLTQVFNPQLGNFLLGAPVFEKNKLHFYQVNGRYQEDTETNGEETVEILQKLNAIQKTPQRTYPSVGIVCFTKGQRNLMASYLLRIKQKRSPGVETIQQLERNGLQILSLDEVGGQPFDVLMISGTFGTINVRGKLSDHIKRLNEQATVFALQLLMGMTKSELHYFNSVPNKDLAEMSQAVDHPGTYILANYCAFIQAETPDDCQAVVQRAQDQLEKSSADQSVNATFLEAAAQALKPYFQSGRLQLDAFQHALFIRAIQRKQLSFALLADGFQAHHEATDYEWEHQARQSLPVPAERVLFLWGAEWWRNAELEAKRLAGNIIRLEQAVEEEE
ncbi:MAG TPA: hypothetical protein PKA00_21635 [Saprospiraceae bacterium]|nr:hypothetical protein [Saprospiraceae bacterium]HMQ85528.1 hypothetical protein [Saprospiraceae bacterium]